MHTFIKLSSFAIFLLIVAEVSLRIVGMGDPPIAIVHPSIEYYPKPNMTYQRFGNLISINRYGMRSHDFQPSEKFDIKLSIFGDSVVYGNHFLGQEDTIANHLRTHYTNKGYTTVRSAAIAASSWGPQNIEAYIEEFGIFPGDIAILVQSSHDRVDIIPEKPAVIFPYRTSSSATAISDLIEALLQKLIYRFFNHEPEATQLSFEQKLDITDQSYKRTIEKLKSHYKRVIFVYHASLDEVKARPEQTNAFEAYFRNLAKEHNIDYIDSTVHYRSAENHDDLFEDLIHLSEEGTYFFTKMLTSHIGDIKASQ